MRRVARCCDVARQFSTVLNSRSIDNGVGGRHRPFDFVDANAILPNMRLASHLQTRTFAKQTKDSKDSPLTNEYLIAEIMKKFPTGTDPEDVQVRAVKDIQGKSTSNIVTLKEAIQVAIEEDKDLVEIALEQQVPVVKVISLAALEYQQSKTKKPAAAALPEKEVQLKAGIAENDLLRKIDQMVSYLQKGHKVKIRIRGTRRVLTQNREAVQDTLNEVLKLVEKEGELFREPAFNEQRTQVHATIQSIPTKKKLGKAFI